MERVKKLHRRYESCLRQNEVIAEIARPDEPRPNGLAGRASFFAMTIGTNHKAKTGTKI